MRVMVLVKSDKNSETGIPLTKETKETFAAMGKFNEELVKAGVILAGEGLQPSSKGKRVRFSGKERKVIDGPFWGRGGGDPPGIRGVGLSCGSFSSRRRGARAGVARRVAKKNREAVAVAHLGLEIDCTRCRFRRPSFDVLVEREFTTVQESPARYRRGPQFQNEEKKA